MSKANTSSSPVKLMSSSLPKRRNPSRAGRGDVFISSSKTTYQEEIFRAEAVFTHGPAWRRCPEVGCFLGNLLRKLFTEDSQQSWVISEDVPHVGDLGAVPLR